jgi:hypothetical protein
MWVSQKLINFFEQNADKSKDEIINLLMERFNFKRSTAKQRYIDYNNSKNGVNYKKITFEFFDKNPWVIEELESKKYAEKLGIATSTYTCYKTQYKAMKELERHELAMKRIKNNPPIEPPKYGEKYYKGRLREFFKIDDSRL